MNKTQKVVRENLMRLISNQIASCGKDHNERFYALQYAWDYVVVKPDKSLIELPPSLAEVVGV